MFSQPKKVVDRWVGNEPISLHDGNVKILAYTFGVVAEEITDQQKNIALKILKKYNEFWREIEPKVTKKYRLTDLTDRLLMYIPGRVGKDVYEFMLGYEFLHEGVLYSAFFAYNNDQLVYELLDCH